MIRPEAPSPAPSPGAARQGITAGGATGVGLASLLAALSGWAVLTLATRVLDEAQNADFLAFWGLLFFLFGVLGGLQSEVTRSVHLARAPAVGTPVGASVGASVGAPAGERPRPVVLPLALLVGGLGAAVIVATSPLWATAVLGPRPTVLVALVALAVLAFAGHSAVAGALAGRGEWTTYSRLVGAEAVARLAVAGAVAAAGAGPLGLPGATAAAAGTWILLLASSTVRSATLQRLDQPTGAFLRAAGQAMLGAAASAALVVGFPVLVRVSTAPETYDRAAPLLLAVLLTRAPLLIPLNAYQGVAITHFLTHRDEGARPLVRIGGALVGVGALGAVAAAAVGPWLMTLLFGDAYRVDPLVLAGLTVSAALLALLTLTGAATLALGGHRAYASGWLTATVCASGLLLLPGALETRVVTSLAIGPLLGVALHLLWVRRATRGRR